MEPIADVTVRVLELMLDELIDQLHEMPEGEQKRELTERANRLDEALLGMTT